MCDRRAASRRWRSSGGDSAECRIGPEQSCELQPMQDAEMQNAECTIGPKAMNWHPMQDADAECRMQNRAQSQMPCLHPMQDAGCGCRMQNRAQSCELHPTDKLFGSDFASCILHPASRTMQKNPFWGDDSASCILHSACCTYRVNILGWVLHSAFCICILHFQRNTECRISPSMQRQTHAVCVLWPVRV